MKTKQCKCCLLILPIDRFEVKKQYQVYIRIDGSISKSNRTTVRGTCRKCMNDKYTYSWVSNNRARYNKNSIKWQNKNRAKLGDWYIKCLLKRLNNGSMKNIPESVIKLKRKQYVLKKEIKSNSSK